VVKINAGGGGGAVAKASLEKMSVAPEVEEFGGFGINKSVAPVQVASLGKASTASAASSSTSSFPISETYEKPDPKKEAIQKRKENYQERKQIAASANDTPKQQAAAKRLLDNNDNILRAEAAEYVYDVDEFNRGHIDELPDAPIGLNLRDPKKIKGLEKATFMDDDSGFGAALFKSEINGQYMLTFRGTNNGVTGKKDWGTNYDQALGRETEQYNQAMDLADDVKQVLEGDFVNVGHSLAGGQASAASAVTGVKGYTFNSAGLHPSTVARQSGRNNEAVAKLIQTRAVKGEVLTLAQENGNKALSVLGAGGGVWLGGLVGAGLGYLASKALPDIPEALGEMKTLPSIKGGNPIKRHGMDQVIEGIEAQKKQDINTLSPGAFPTVWDK
jgi:hypothetical protein